MKRIVIIGSIITLSVYCKSQYIALNPNEKESDDTFYGSLNITNDNNSLIDSYLTKSSNGNNDVVNYISNSTSMFKQSDLNIQDDKNKRNYVYIWDKTSKYYVKDEGFTSKFHEQNAGKILFSDKEIKRENTDISYFKTSFDNNSAAIYGRVYLPTSVCNYAVYKNGDSTNKPTNNPYSYYVMNLYADGKFLVKTDRNHSGTKSLESNITTFYSNIIWSVEKRDKKQWFAVIDSLNKLKPGVHKMRLELIGDADAYSKVQTVVPIAVGEFDLNILPGKKFKYGVKWADIKAGMVNETVVAKALSIMNTKSKEEKWIYTFKKAKITDSEWTVEKNYLGVPEYKRIDIEFYVVLPNGSCNHVNITFHQDYINGSYGPLKYSSMGSYTELDCE
ncbi:MAG: hypothetical protein J0L69_00935 [Bacteroidetes bacterium]|nr:hypothetical protein [Bacteroidota bacterium]